MQESFNNIDNLSVIEKAHEKAKAAHEKAKAAEKASAAAAEGDAVVSRKGVTPLSPIAR